MEVRNYKQRQGAGGIPNGFEVWNWMIQTFDMVCAGLLAGPGTDQCDLFSFAPICTILALMGYIVAARERGTPACLHLTGPSRYIVGEAQFTGQAVS